MIQVEFGHTGKQENKENKEKEKTKKEKNVEDNFGIIWTHKKRKKTRK